MTLESGKESFHKLPNPSGGSHSGEYCRHHRSRFSPASLDQKAPPLLPYNVPPRVPPPHSVLVFPRVNDPLYFNRLACGVCLDGRLTVGTEVVAVRTTADEAVFANDLGVRVTQRRGGRGRGGVRVRKVFVQVDLLDVEDLDVHVAVREGLHPSVGDQKLSAAALVELGETADLTCCVDELQ